MSSARKPWWQKATAVVSLSASGAVTGFSFAPRATADLSSPSKMMIHLMALDEAGQPAKSGQAAASGDARLRSAIVSVARYYLRMAAGKTPAEMEAVIWEHDSIDGADHGQSCAAFASLTLELGARVVGERSWVTGGTTYPWPLHKWADVRVDPNPDSLGITSVLQDAQAHHRWHPLGDGYQPLPGDWVLFHGHVEVVTDYSGGVLHTIGGDSLPNYSVNAHEYHGSLAADGVAGFVNNGELDQGGQAAGSGGAGRPAVRSPGSGHRTGGHPASGSRAGDQHTGHQQASQHQAGQRAAHRPATGQQAGRQQADAQQAGDHPAGHRPGAGQAAIPGTAAAPAAPGGTNAPADSSAAATRDDHPRDSTGHHAGRTRGSRGGAAARSSARGDAVIPGLSPPARGRQHRAGAGSPAAPGIASPPGSAPPASAPAGSSPAGSSPAGSSAGSDSTGSNADGRNADAGHSAAGRNSHAGHSAAGHSSATGSTDIPGLTGTAASGSHDSPAHASPAHSPPRAASGHSPPPAAPAHAAQKPAAGSPAHRYTRHHPSPAAVHAGDTPAQQAFISAIAPGAIAAQREWGVPASVTIAQAIDESGWGRSELATRDHNLFGIKGEGPVGTDAEATEEYVHGHAVHRTASFRVYQDDAQSISDHGRLLATSGYYTRAMADRDDPDAFAADLTGVYATDPGYGAKLVGLMRRYDLYRYDSAGVREQSGARAPVSHARAAGGSSRRQPGTAPSPAPATAAPARTSAPAAQDAAGGDSAHGPAGPGHASPGHTGSRHASPAQRRGRKPASAPAGGAPAPSAAAAGGQAEPASHASPGTADIPGLPDTPPASQDVPAPARPAPSAEPSRDPARQAGPAQSAQGPRPRRAARPATPDPAAARRAAPRPAQPQPASTELRPDSWMDSRLGSGQAPAAGHRTAARRAPQRGTPERGTPARSAAPRGTAPGATAAPTAVPRRPAAPRQPSARRAPARGARYQGQIPVIVQNAFAMTARLPLMRAEPLYRDVAEQAGIRWQLLAACDWMQCKAQPRYSPVHGEKLGTINPDGTCYHTKSEALEQCADDLLDLSWAVYQIDLTRSAPLSVRDLANVFAAFRWGGLLKLHRTSAMEFPYSVAGLTDQHASMRWPAISDQRVPDKPGSRFRPPFGAVPVVLILKYPASA